MISIAALTGCSNGLPKGVDVTVTETKQVHPAPPGEIKLQDVDWQKCGSKFCLSASDVQKELRNKAVVGRWMSQAKNVICYYRSFDPPERPAYCQQVKKTAAKTKAGTAKKKTMSREKKD